MRRDHANFFHFAIYSVVIILVVCIIPYLLPRIPGRPEFFNERIISSTNQDEIKELKKEVLKEYHLRFDYDDVLGCKTGVPPWDCGIENLQIINIYVQRNYFAQKQYIGKYFEYIVNSYRNKKGYTFRLYVTKENLPHQFTNLHPVDFEREEYTIGGRIVTVQKLSDEGDKALNFYLTSDDWYGYKLMGLIVYENQETIADSTSDIQEILEKLLKDH
ncbi:hypothetical protein [uncultured Solobacterium sp.]|uniref:hypothetical protein n=1 Tax=uncultured Solobacterium sp. TaxID=747375 RepID=UPI0028F01007|nr:hypothetical protein [uncultured Solobacterium sp.]